MPAPIEPGYRDALDPLRTLLQEGEYRVIYLRCDKVSMYARLNWYVTFSVSELGPHFGKRLLRFYALPKGPRLARASSLAQDFMAVVNKLPPMRGLRPESFLKDREVVARVATVTTKMDNGRRVPIPAQLHYSKITAIARATTGPAVFSSEKS